MEERKGPKRMEECLPLLFSGDWKKRLVGEYWETKIRSAALKEYIERRTEEEHKWNESMEHHIMSRQLSDMLGYLSCLGLRAMEKNIDLMDTEIPEDEHLILINGNEGMGRTQLTGDPIVCANVLLTAAAEIAISMKKEEAPMGEFIEEFTTIFAGGLYKIARRREENGCK